MKKQLKSEPKTTSPTQTKQLKTDPPLSEKDEVKAAERRTNKTAKN